MRGMRKPPHTEMPLGTAIATDCEVEYGYLCPKSSQNLQYKNGNDFGTFGLSLRGTGVPQLYMSVIVDVKITVMISMQHPLAWLLHCNLCE